MSFINPLINAVDNFAWRIISSMKGTTFDYCDLDTPLNQHTFVTKKGELISFIEILGCSTLMGEAEFIEASQRLELLLNNLLEKPRHSFQWVFSRLASQTHDYLVQMIEPLKQSAERQALQTQIIDYLLNERVETLGRYIVNENCILAFKTHIQALDNIEKNEQKNIKEKSVRLKELKEAGIPLKFGYFAQSPFVSCERLNTIHQAAMNTVLEKLTSKEIGLQIKLFNTHTAVKTLRQMILPDQTSNEWRPVLPGDPLPQLAKPRAPGQRDHEFYPLIAEQIFKQQVVQLGNVVQVCEDFLASCTLELPPQVPERFDRLFAALPKHIDWRFSLSLIGGDSHFISKLKSRHAWAKIFKITNASQNESIIDATQNLLTIHKEGEKLCGLRMNLTVRSHSREKALANIHLCARIFQAWGNLDTRFEHGDPWDTVVASLPGLDSKSTGYTVITPVRESTIFCPITRPMSPWHEGASNLWRTLDGKPFPYQSCSSLQHTWVSLIYATPGGGKSVALNAQNLNLCLSPGLSRLPKISILDIGPSSHGFIELLKSMLPANRQHEAIHRTLKNDKYSAINPFDAPLGFRYPNTAKMEYLANFLLILFTEKGQETIKPGLGELVPDLIHAVYRHFSDEKNPKTYVAHLEPLVDEIMARHPQWFEIPDNASARYKLTWWKIVDTLAAHEYWNEAALAQRNAVPLLGDLTAILHINQQLKDTHNATLQDEALFAHLNKMIRSAISQYPILAYPTQFNTQQARVVALDLADVVGANDKFSLKRAGLMYMLGRQALVGDYYFSEDDLKDHHGPTRPYHEARLNRELSEIKRVCYDEFHRTAQLAGIRQQVIQDMREARKFKIDIVLISQIDTDFDEAMVELATSIFIFRGSEGKALDRVCKTFDLNDSARHALKYQVHGASREGASFMLKCQTKTGSFVQVLVNTMGPTELWALASTAEDALLRRRLTQHMSYLQAIQLLAKAYPAGSCKKEVDEAVSEKGLAMEDVIELIVTKLCQSKNHEVNYAN